MDEIFEITEFVQEEAGYGTDLIWGNCYDESLGDKISVTVIATGFDHREKAKSQAADDRVVVHLDDEKSSPKPQSPTGLRDITGEDDPVGFNKAGTAPTFEFEDIEQAKARLRDRQVNNPYLQREEMARREAERMRQEEEDRLRREQLRSRQQRQMPKLNNPRVVSELENQPAYLRRNIQLDNTPPTNSDQEQSRWSITDDEDAPLRRDNAFLHDNVD